MMRAGAWHASVLLAGVLLVPAMITGCQRKPPQFVQARADSTDADMDSLTAQYRDVQRAWDMGEPAEDMVAATAEALREALTQRLSGEWPRRAQRLLDSLGVGAEIAPGECALAVNFFARSDPDGESWPFLYWCSRDGARVQPVEGKGLRLSQIAVRGMSNTLAAGRPASGNRPGVAALFQRRAAGGLQPMLMVWASDTSRAKWRMVQTLGPDSLGGVGTGEFAGADTTLDLTLRTYQSNAFFDECPTCPHVYRVHRFRWGAAGFRRADEQLVPSPYSTFVQFIQALAGNDLYRADALVTDPVLTDEARRLGWASRSGKWRVAPGVEETPERMVFYRGPTEAFAVHFAQRGGDWLVAGFDPTERVVE